MNTAIFSKNRQVEVNRFITILLNRNDPALGRSLHRRPTSNNYPLSKAHSRAATRRIKGQSGAESENNTKSNPISMTTGYRQKRNAAERRARLLRARRLCSLRRGMPIHRGKLHISHTARRRARRAIMTRKGKRKIIIDFIGANSVSAVENRPVSQYLPSHSLLVKKFHFTKVLLADPGIAVFHKTVNSESKKPTRMGIQPNCSLTCALTSDNCSGHDDTSVLSTSDGLDVKVLRGKAINRSQMHRLKEKAKSAIQAMSKDTSHYKRGVGCSNIKPSINDNNQTVKIVEHDGFSSYNNTSRRKSVALTPVRVSTKLSVSKQRTALLRILMCRGSDPGHIIYEASHKYNFSQIILRDGFNSSDSFDDVSLLSKVASSLVSICGGRIRFPLDCSTSTSNAGLLSSGQMPFRHHHTNTLYGSCSFPKHSSSFASTQSPSCDTRVMLSQVRIAKGSSVLAHSSEGVMKREEYNNKDVCFRQGTCKGSSPEVDVMGSIFIISASPVTMYNISLNVHNGQGETLIDHIHHCSVWAAASPLTCERCLRKQYNNLHTDSVQNSPLLVSGVSSVEVLSPWQHDNNSNSYDLIQNSNSTTTDRSNNNNYESDISRRQSLDTNNIIEKKINTTHYSINRESLICVSTVPCSEVLAHLTTKLNCEKPESERIGTTESRCNPSPLSNTPDAFVVDVATSPQHTLFNNITLSKGFALWCHGQHAKHFSDARRVFQSLLLRNGDSHNGRGNVLVCGSQEIDSIIGAVDSPIILDKVTFFVERK
eukprot:Tbor_TRINITY_DN5168_c1_g1::TRINITY_DN5168_c1_g1_i2::g.25614::m.25614